MRRIILAAGEEFGRAHLQRKSAFNAQALAAATEIVEDVRQRGDQALIELTQKFDGVTITQLRVPQEAIEQAAARCDAETTRALEHAANQIRDFHQRQLQQSWFATRPDGALVGAKVTPLDSVGVYVPGGRALYPSTLLMNAIPASVAGVERIVVVTPPSRTGELDPAICSAALRAGVSDV